VISGLQNLNPNKVGQVDNLFTRAKKYGEQYEHWNGIDAAINLRLRRGILLQGGMSTGRTSTDNCEVVRAVPESAVAGSSNSPLFCHVDTAFQTQVKFLGSYTVPKIDVQLAANVLRSRGMRDHEALDEMITMRGNAQCRQRRRCFAIAQWRSGREVHGPSNYCAA
jgi:hypothetical protein